MHTWLRQPVTSTATEVSNKMQTSANSFQGNDISNQQDAAKFVFIDFFKACATCFGRQFCPSSGTLYVQLFGTM